LAQENSVAHLIRCCSGRVATALLVAGLVVSGYSAEKLHLTSTTTGAAVGSTGDINPQAPATLRDGGNLRLALTEFPSNFNALHIDGNQTDSINMQKACMPRTFVIGLDGSMTVNTDYFTSVELTETAPQVVTYTINPKAIWSDGTPITWEDIASQVRATAGVDKRFAIASTNGSERVASVTRGVDDRQAVVTFAKPYAEWRGMFAGNGMLLPKSMTATPEAFNKGQLDRPGPSAGPFIVSSLDRTAQRIILTRNPKWWGKAPRLDTITHLVLDDAARLPALQDKTIDATIVSTLDQLTTAERTGDVSIRWAPAPSWYHFTFNGAPGSILADKALRLAIAKGIDTQTIAKVTQRGLVNEPVSLKNHVYIAGQQGYQDNSTIIAYDPEQAKRELDALGWKLNGQFREKNGRQLIIRDLLYNTQLSRQFGLMAQHSLSQVGVKLELDAKASKGFFTDYVNVGAFDMAQFGWAGDAFPLATLTQIYASSGGNNFGKIGSSEIDTKIEQTLAELDPAKARALANDVDKLIWAEGFSLPMTQSPGHVAVRSSLANFGPTGVADLDYTAIGFIAS
jgi:peptide/nickel transport system substrate-binding protein